MAVAPQSLAQPDEVMETYLRIRAATCDETGFSREVRDEHIRNVTAIVLEARVRGTLVNRENWRLT